MTTESEMDDVTEFATILYNFRDALKISNIKANIQSFLLANHYVKLVEMDYRYLPTKECYCYDNGWRKVEMKG